MKQIADASLTTLKDDIRRFEFTLDQAKSALAKVMEDSPPNAPKDQQFKDSVIWAVILEIAHSSNVDFVTQDKGFYQDKDPKKGLASELMEDAKDLPGDIRIFYEIKDYLTEIEGEIPKLDKEDIVSKINTSIDEQLQGIADEKGFHLGSIKSGDIQGFLTSVPEIISVSYTLKYSTNDVILPETGEELIAELVVNGSCGFNLKSKQILDNQFNYRG